MELIGKALKTILMSDGTITDRMGANIWHMRVPQGQEYNRYIRFYVNRVRPSDTKSGQSEIDYQEVRIEIVATDDETIAVTAKAVRDLLDRYPHGTVEGVTLEGCAFMDCVALPDEPDIADRMRMMLEFHFRVARTRTR